MARPEADRSARADIPTRRIGRDASKWGKKKRSEHRHGCCCSQPPAMLHTTARASFQASSEPHAPLCGERPILLLHGFLATAHVVRLLAARLRRSGYCPHDVDLGGLFGRFNARPVEALAGVVAERVEQLLQYHPCERIDLVGHSKGGLIGRYYVQKLNGAHRVRHLVTLGTPHRGTPWAYSGYLVRRVLPSLREMAPGSPLLRQLPDDSFPASVRLTSVYSLADPFCPPSACRLEDGWGAHLRNREASYGGHLAFLSSVRVSSIIRQELDAVHAGGMDQRIRATARAA